MQNIALHSAYTPTPAMLAAEHALLSYAIPTARKIGMQIVWLNWGVAEKELQAVTPAEIRVFGSKANSDRPNYGLSQHHGDPTDPENFLNYSEMPRLESMPGASLGRARLEDGMEKDAGRKTMRGMWNAELHGPLLGAYEEGRRAEIRNVLVWKNKNSGLLDAESDCNVFLRDNNICILLFAGVNTGQCVMASLQDAHARGYDTTMLKDGCATDSPKYVHQAEEYNLCRNWGFLSSCRALTKPAGC